MLAGGWSEWFWSGTTHETAGSVPARASARKREVGWMSQCWAQQDKTVPAGRQLREARAHALADHGAREAPTGSCDLLRLEPAELVVVHAAHRISLHRAVGRPPRHHVQVHR